eukprot:CAMPEP_0198326676 /NCGR_PEP_ID=MMETSP1450-20131203/14133_1 /TAXON_ID=753684 ORGANISM="Madagascaria erythrocladiodes, Strain CCMP3234" /NCGR_SAMPLE_ID=MMETSP1450 /ASSEMBLY_ACC=CAM_ASM_001115 /LENGTH=163 /DNA_ID=CAMNT_0044030653 /DNA_START=85 /DNA_END=576 /DNA_ORIENTATION=+
MASFLAGAVGSASFAPLVTAAAISAKALSELHRAANPAPPLVLAANANNNLARQGLAGPALPGANRRAESDRVGGIRGGVSKKDGEAPAYLEKVPKKEMTGDLRKDYAPGGLGDATSSKGNLSDILAKVPNRGAYGGNDDYRRANRAPPSRQGGFGNQSFPET